MKTEKNILIAFIMNVLFSIIEFIGGFITGSIAITSDAIHDAGDAISIGISYFLERISKKKPDKKYTYGYIRYSIIGSIITTVILLVGSIYVIVESIKRIISPIEVNYNGMFLLAILGVLINFIASYVTKEGDSLNQKAVNLHMLEDTLGWFVVLIGSLLMMFTNISIIDPLLSLGVSTFLLVSALKNMKSVIDVFLEVTPDNIDIDELKKYILKIDGVVGIHHVHVRSIDGFKTSATLHVVVLKYSKRIKDLIREELKEFGIIHSTIELELKDEECDDKKCDLKNCDECHMHHHH